MFWVDHVIREKISLEKLRFDMGDDTFFKDAFRITSQVEVGMILLDPLKTVCVHQLSNFSPPTFEAFLRHGVKEESIALGLLRSDDKWYMLHTTNFTFNTAPYSATLYIIDDEEYLSIFLKASDICSHLTEKDDSDFLFSFRSYSDNERLEKVVRNPNKLADGHFKI